MNTGNTAFMMICTALVFFMTPGLAFFYGGLVRRKNVCNTMMACVAIMGLSVLLWTMFGYSLSFGGNHAEIIGDFRWAFLNDVGWEAGPYADTIPHLVFAAFQMMFAMITPALITGAVVGRMRFKALFAFIALWSFLVYYPMAHMVWGEGGFLAAIGSVDFAGGNVVHISSGVSALVLATYLGRRKGYEKTSYRIHNIPFVVLGASLLWFGWFGFNAGSALAADGLVRVIERLNSGSSASDNTSSGSDNNTSNNSGRKLNIASLVVNINKEDTNVILGRECVTLYGRPYIEDYIGDIKFQISPLSFFQVNPKQTEVLYNKALEFANLTGNEAVWDLYCGIGTISLFLAKNAGMVYGVEIVPQAIEDAKNNAGINGIDNAEFFVGKAEEVVTAFYESRKADDGTGHNMTRPDVIVVDPPRKGCDEKLLDTIVTMSPQRVVYVSCDSATLARDLKVLSERGYKIVKVQPVDQFANTVHVETVVLLSQLKQKPDDYINVTIELDDMDITSA